MSLSDRYKFVTATIGRRPLALATVLVVFITLIALFATGTVRFPSRQTTMDFALRQRVSAASTLQFSFPALMDHQSVVENITVPDAMTGSWLWTDETLSFHPASSLPAGKTVIFRLDRAAKKSDGSILGQDLDFTFTVAGPPAIAGRIPEVGAQDVAETSKITIIFDRPMIPLTQVQGDAAQARLANWPVTISPDTAGRWRWLSTVAVEFIPEKGLLPSTRYTVSIPKGIQTVSGDKTEEDFSWTFETARPQVASTDPVANYSLAGPTTLPSLTFNQEMDSGSAKAFLSLTRDGENGTPEEIPIRSVAYGKTEVNKRTVSDRTMLVITPANPLTFSSKYTLTVAPGITGAKGTLGNGTGFTLHFSTVGTLKVEQSSFEYSRVLFKFSNPLAEDSIKNQMEITPAVAQWKETEWQLSSWQDNRELSAYPQLKPSTEYTITLKTGIKDTFGQSLKEPVTYAFKTPPLDPQLLLESKGAFGIFERAKAPIYRMKTVNITKAEAELSSVSLADFLAFRNLHQPPDSLPENLTPLRSWTYVPKAGKDMWDIHDLDMSQEAKQSLPSGLFALRVRAPNENGYDGKPLQFAQIFALTNTTLTLKYSGNRALVWATDLTSGDPVGGAQIVFHALDGKEIVTGRTDKEGFFETEIDMQRFVTSMNEWEPEFWVTAKKGDDFALVSSRWNDGIRPDMFGFFTDFWNPSDRSERIHSTLYTDRPIYRAGDTVHFKGILRSRNREGLLSLPEKSRTVTVTVRDSNGNQILSKSLPLTDFGSFADDVPIDANAPLGSYQISAGFQESAYGDAYGSFDVLAYRKPEYRVDLTTEREDYFQDDTVQAAIEGAYYFGAPMGGAHVAWRAQTTDYFFNKVQDDWYSFGLEDAWCWQNCERQTKLLAEGEGTLDAAGRLTVSVPAKIDDKPVSQILTIEADVTDPNNQVVSNRVSVPVHKADAYVGVKTQDYVVTPGTDASIAVVTVRPDGSPLPRTTVTVNLYSRKWNTVKKKGVDGQYYYDNTPEDTFIRATKVTTDEKGKAKTAVRPDQGGEFRVVAVVEDAQGRQAKAATGLYAWSSTYVNWPHQNNNRIDVVPDKAEYRIGDTATLLIKSPFQGKNVRALVTVEREQVIHRQVITIESTAQKIIVPITEDLLPTAYVSVVVIKPRVGETFNESGLDTGAPAFRIGYAKLPIDTASKHLTVTVQPDKEKYLPGEKVTVRLNATDWQGKPAKAELSLGVVDMSVLALTGFELPDLVSQFYSERPVGVLTAEMLTFLIDRYKPGSKGGGGADLEAKKRGNFKDTAYWNPTILTDENGEAKVSFTLPDNLTTWHLLAVGQTRASTFGAAENTVIETKHVIVRPVRPRFGVVGDRITLGAIVHNFLDTPATFTVSLTGSGFMLSGQQGKQVTIGSGEQTKVAFPVTISRANKATFTFLARNETARDEVEESIPILPYGALQSAATTGITEDIATEHVFVPSEKDARDGSLTVTVSPSLATYLPGGLQYLAGYPYGCAEQTLSSVLPDVVLTRLQGFDAFHIVDRKKLDDMVTTGLTRLYTFQRGDGGFGYWQESTRSYPALSAYALQALSLIQGSGFAVDDGVIARTRQYLDAALRTSDPHVKLDAAIRAQILFVLAETGGVDVSLLNNLDEQRGSLPLFAKAELAMAFDRTTSKAKARDILTEILRSAKVDGRGTHFEEEDIGTYGSLMHTNDRTSALVLQAMLRIDPKNPLIPNAVRYLLAIRKDGHWDTTQSTVSVLLAFIEYLQQTKELDADFTASVEVNEATIIDWKVTKQNVLSRKEVKLALDELIRGETTTLNIGKKGKGRLYYDAVLSYFYTADTLPPAEEGISILRSTEPLPDQKQTPTVGNTYRVTLTITVPEARHFVAIESPFPAGFEPIDVNLETAQKTLLSDDTTHLWDENYWQSGLWRFTHRELRDDMFFAFADELPAGVYQLTYLVRATTPGTFHERPAKVFEMYFPEVFGQTEGTLVTIGE
ncbi:MAG: Ig-like domain-containing protein [Candidatus Peribacteraceae bacterium]|nr:Ig-like domain-containing protein [Candidatus Peribacteraceae bacterium]MDD5742667.1 Ig-like domain-containing protein [Candidatus Peribacteraceae bacterium]